MTTVMSEDDKKDVQPDAPAPMPDATQLSEEAKRVQSEWEKYFAGLGDDYLKRVTDLAKKQAFTISLRKPTGRKIKHPITEQEEPEYKGWEERNYERGKIASPDWHMVEKMRAQMAKEKDQEKVMEMMAKIYEFLAYCYLGMPHDEYVRTDWEELKPIIDACNFRTIYSLPN
jgi:hypothetical protein